MTWGWFTLLGVPHSSFVSIYSPVNHRSWPVGQSLTYILPHIKRSWGHRSRKRLAKTQDKLKSSAEKVEAPAMWTLAEKPTFWLYTQYSHIVTCSRIYMHCSANMIKYNQFRAPHSFIILFLLVFARSLPVSVLLEIWESWLSISSTSFCREFFNLSFLMILMSHFSPSSVAKLKGFLR